MPTYHRFSTGTNYQLQVTNVVAPTKSFPKGAYPGIPFFATKIYFKDKSGKEYMGEYVQAHKSDQDYFKVGEEALFYASSVSGIVDEIMPGHIAVRNEKAPAQQEVQLQAPQRRAVQQASGQTYTFAMGYAKDVYCKMVDAGQIVGEADHPDNIGRLVFMAKQINAGLIEMQEEQTITHR